MLIKADKTVNIAFLIIKLGSPNGSGDLLVSSRQDHKILEEMRINKKTC